MEELGELLRDMIYLLWETTQDASLRTSAICVSLGVALLLGGAIALACRLTRTDSPVSASFLFTLVLMPVLGAAMVLSMQTSVFLSLGMIGALSILRFRNSVREPLQMMFLYGSVAAGLICGAGLNRLAVLTVAAAALALLVFGRVPAPRPQLLLIVHGRDPGAEKPLGAAVKRYATAAHIRSRVISDGGLELLIALRTARGAELLAAIRALPAVESARLLAPDGTEIAEARTGGGTI